MTEPLGGYIKQVIVIVNESEVLRKICDQYKFDLFEFTDMSKIINELEKIGSDRSQKIISQLRNY
ncbi:MAG: hypothetical protein L0H53_16075 [Candidatus Nitrosocosmicus sp.]|nr:hypothetical protein [Candidatus Nitrosocosmicus sp.]